MGSLHFGPNMTPMVDVVMVILVFFMASAAFVGPEWFLNALVPFAAPAAGAAAQNPAGKGGGGAEERRQVEIRLLAPAQPGGPVVAEGLGLTGSSIEAVLAALAEEVKRRGVGNVEVIIRPEAAVPYREVVRTHEGCERLGLSRVGIAAGVTGAAPGAVPTNQPANRPTTLPETAPVTGPAR